MDSQYTILVVDDEPGLTDLYAAWLQESYEVRIATSGEQALDVMDGDVDALLLDRQMPDLSGDEALERLRTRGYECPVALVTAARPTAGVFDLTFVDYLVKPITREEVFAAVHRLASAADLDRATRRWLRLASITAIIEENTLDARDVETALIERARRELDQLRANGDGSIEEVFESGPFPIPCWESALGRDPLAD